MQNLIYVVAGQFIGLSILRLCLKIDEYICSLVVSW